LLQDGQPLLAVGAAGGPTIISQTLLAILHTVDFRLIFPHLGAGFGGRRNRRNSLAGAAWPGVAQAPPVRFS
jgi:hypothetical protein